MTPLHIFSAKQTGLHSIANKFFVGSPIVKYNFFSNKLQSLWLTCQWVSFMHFLCNLILAYFWLKLENQAYNSFIAILWNFLDVVSNKIVFFILGKHSLKINIANKSVMNDLKTKSTVHCANGILSSRQKTSEHDIMTNLLMMLTHAQIYLELILLCKNQ